jgi:hypothetical protein
MKHVAAVFLTFGMAGCAPCSGVIGCTDDGSLRVEGRLVQVLTGQPSPGARIRLTFAQTNLEAVTDNAGLFQFALSDVGPQTLEYDLEVSPVAESSYVVPHQLCTVSNISGSGCVLSPMTTRPVVFGGGFVHYRGVGGAQLGATPVVFRRTGGARIYGDSVHNDAISFAIDDQDGHVNLLPKGVFSRDVTDVVGDFVVSLPAPLDSSVLRGLHLPASAAFNEQPPVQFLFVGPSVKTRFRFVGANGQPVQGVRVQFMPTGGIALTGAGLMAVSDDSGYATIDPIPGQWGAAMGNLTVDAMTRGGTTFTIGQLTLEAHDDDSTRTAGTWNVTSGAAASKRP